MIADHTRHAGAPVYPNVVALSSVQTAGAPAELRRDRTDRQV
jgi:hypothetical protein